MKTKRMARNALHKRDTGAVSITNYLDLVYYVNATVGTPSQNLAFLIDIESPDAWISGTELSRQSDFGSCKLISMF